MFRFISALVASAALVGFAVPASAQSGAMASATKAPKATKMSAMKGMNTTKTSTMAATPKCAAGQSMVKGYTKKDGSVVKAYCRKSK